MRTIHINWSKVVVFNLIFVSFTFNTMIYVAIITARNEEKKTQENYLVTVVLHTIVENNVIIIVRRECLTHHTIGIAHTWHHFEDKDYCAALVYFVSNLLFVIFIPSYPLYARGEICSRIFISHNIFVLTHSLLYRHMFYAVINNHWIHHWYAGCRLCTSFVLSNLLAIQIDIDSVWLMSHCLFAGGFSYGIRINALNSHAR